MTIKKKIEILEGTIAHFEKQGKLALEGGQCLYRTSDGCKCAIGWMIPDEDYIPAMDRSVSSAVSGNEHVQKVLMRRHGFEMVDFTGKDARGNFGFLRMIQSIHDKSDHSPAAFKAAMERYRGMLEELQSENVARNIGSSTPGSPSEAPSSATPTGL